MKSEIKTTERKRASNKYRNAVVVLAIVLGLIILSILLIIKLTSNKNTNEYDRKNTNEYDRKISNEYDRKISNEYDRKTTNEYDRKNTNEYDRKISEAMDEINKKLDDVSKEEDPNKRNNHFKELEFHHSLTPLFYSKFSAVFKVTMETGETTVLKRIIWDDSNGFNEDIIVMRLKEDCHPNIVVPLFTKRTHRSVETEDGKTKKQVLIWIFFEYLELNVTRGKVKADEDYIKKIMKDVLEGVKYLHDRNLAHGDIKIHNIMGTKDNAGNVVYKLIDFGFTQEFDERVCKIPGKSFGTLPYNSPEVLISHIHGMPNDIWCIGMTAYFLSRNKILFMNKKNMIMIRKNSKFLQFISFINNIFDPKKPDDKRYFFTEDTSEDLMDFIKSCTRLDYLERPTIDKLLKHPFITKVIA